MAWAALAAAGLALAIPCALAALEAHRLRGRVDSRAFTGPEVAFTFGLVLSLPLAVLTLFVSWVLVSGLRSRAQSTSALSWLAVAPAALALAGFTVYYLVGQAGSSV